MKASLAMEEGVKSVPLPPSRFHGTAFVLAGGGSHGAVQVGMLQALVGAGVRPDFIVGTSVGALNGLFFASDPTSDGVARMAAIWRGLAEDGIYPNLPLAWLRALIGRRTHIVDPARLRRLLATRLVVKELQDTVLPIAVVAADLRDGEEVVLTEGVASDAVVASAAIPGLFPPVRIGDRQLVDGALARHSALTAAVTLGATRLIVLPTGFGCAAQEPPRSVLAMALRMVGILLSRQLATEAQTWSARLPVAVVPPICPMPVSSYDFTHSPALIEAAYGTTARWIEAGGLESPHIPTTLAPHHH
ncbi:MAG: patatin-like phospholipase family protein [Gemmatimonadaceae bacterium]